ncbi:thioredoxin family protein [Aestuariibaculum suncheonense]|uniref:Thioredoxin family protein n=1 Tax=Aestuariibaculum suncheonense TaxID=1028745 RepID=A0A8J6UA19_9FLAO|nr:thioredoxin fold domain-containing protein [Aestuariibaculum suncheonense]MBD0834390.1 thioredoxin family protein [Aestuariibaculum suncheonense]
MKNIYKILLVIILMPLFTLGQGIEFEQSSFKEALAKAKKENKLLFIDGYAVWCGPCKRMEKTVFKEAVIGDYFKEHFVAVKVDVERGEGPELKEKYNITGLPGYVFVNGDDEVVYRISGAKSTEDFLKEVTKAVEYQNDPNSIGRLNELYESNKNDEDFVKLYLDKLHESLANNYTDVLEHYLSIQTSIKESSKEMVMLLADHSSQIIIGSQAASIIANNIKTEEWKKYVRKSIRATFMYLPKSMIQQTTEYAILKRDTTYLEKALSEAQNLGLVSKIEEQRKRTYTYYYLNTGQGEKYKALAKDDIKEFVNSLKKEDLRAGYQDWQRRMDEGDILAKGSMPFSNRIGDQLISMVKDYALFANTEEEKQDVLDWMGIVYYIRPGEAIAMSEYANVLYVFGDKNEALSVMGEAVKIAEKDGLKRANGIKKDYEIMEVGGKLTL